MNGDRPRPPTERLGPPQGRLVDALARARSRDVSGEPAIDLRRRLRSRRASRVISDCTSWSSTTRAPWSMPATTWPRFAIVRVPRSSPVRAGRRRRPVAERRDIVTLGSSAGSIGWSNIVPTSGQVVRCLPDLARSRRQRRACGSSTTSRLAGAGDAGRCSPAAMLMAAAPDRYQGRTHSRIGAIKLAIAAGRRLTLDDLDRRLHRGRRGCGHGSITNCRGTTRRSPDLERVVRERHARSSRADALAVTPRTSSPLPSGSGNEPARSRPTPSGRRLPTRKPTSTGSCTRRVSCSRSGTDRLP